MILEDEKCRFLHIIELCKKRRAEVCTIKELSHHLTNAGVKVSERKLSDFENGKNFDFWLLCRYADFLCVKVEFSMK